MDKITTTIERQWLREIVAKHKKVEYREIKPYWQKRFDAVKTPFLLRLINGMQKSAPEVTVEIARVHTNKSQRRFELTIRKIVSTKNWDKKREIPDNNYMHRTRKKVEISFVAQPRSRR